MNNVSYTAGTVSIPAGSATATGTGTVWTDARVQPWGFLTITDTGQVFLIASIDSATQLTLVNKNGGAAISAAAYTIISFPSEMQDSLNIQAIRAFLATASMVIYRTSNPTAGDGIDGTACIVNDGTNPLTIWTKAAGAWTQRSFAASSAGITDATTVGKAVLTAASAAAARTAVGISFQPRELLSSNRAYYVRTDGNDSNDGLTNTSGGAFLTIQQAMNAAYALDSGLYAITINVAAGTYAGFHAAGYRTGTSPISVAGTGAAAADVVVSQSGGNAIDVSSGADVQVSKLTVTGATGLSVSNNARLQFSNIDFGACSSSHIYATNARVVATGAYRITGDAPYHVVAQTRSYITLSFQAVTLVGTRAFSGSFVFASTQAVVEVYSYTFTGAATGARYYSGVAAIIYSGGGPNALPGNSAGSADSSGFALYI